MTKLLEQAIIRLKTLPDDEQDAIAARLLAEIEDEQTWKAQFESTTDDQWDRIAEMVRQEISAGDITPLKVENDSFSRPWWEKITGTFPDNSAYDEAMRLGREYRNSLSLSSTGFLI